MNAPSFLRRAEPAAPPLPQQTQVSPEVAAFIDSTTRQREELAFLRSEVDNLTRELKLAHERIRMVESELTTVRTERDYLLKHDTAILASLNNIQAIIDQAVESARAQPYAPPGSGTQAPAKMSDHDLGVIEDLAKQLAPEPRTDG